MADPVERWGAGERTLRYLVDLTGATVWTSGRRGEPDREHSVSRVAVRTRWIVGMEESGRTTVVLHTRHAGTLYPDQLREVPPWLDSIITRASPRDVG